jgi:hypothetical protein
MKKENVIKKLEELNVMFNNCGNGLELCYMGSWGGKESFRIYRDCEIRSRVNWVKCKKILSKNNIEFNEGHSGWGMIMSRNIDMYFDESEE